MNTHPKTRITIPASQKFSVQTSHVNVRVQGINPVAIPGSFSVHLLKDGERIASKGFFQHSQHIEKAETYTEHKTVYFDFELPLEAISNGEFEVEVEAAKQSSVQSDFLKGSPTVEVYLLLRTG
jgi:hypothetical protein